VPADLRFEVASIKPNTSGGQNVRIGIQPGGRFTATNVPLAMLIRNAYRLQQFQLVDPPKWADEERFDISAKAEGDVPPSPMGALWGVASFRPAARRSRNWRSPWARWCSA
jgi:uncharacterized protein (TIGR03435 family)